VDVRDNLVSVDALQININAICAEYLIHLLVYLLSVKAVNVQKQNSDAPIYFNFVFVVLIIIYFLSMSWMRRSTRLCLLPVGTKSTKDMSK